MYPEGKCFQHCWQQFVLCLSAQAVALELRFPLFYHQLQHWCPLQTCFVMKKTVVAQYCYHILYQWSHFDLLKENINFVQHNHAIHRIKILTHSCIIIIFRGHAWKHSFSHMDLYLSYWFHYYHLNSLLADWSRMGIQRCYKMQIGKPGNLL